MGYDIIGDVHGCATQLEQLLADRGYQPNDWTGAYWHPDRRVVYIGDLIDRGSEQWRVLELVKNMVDSGSAHIVMGYADCPSTHDSWCRTRTFTGRAGIDLPVTRAHYIIRHTPTH